MTSRMVGLIAVVGAVAALLYLLVFDVWVVRGDGPWFAVSVAPNLAADDVVLVSRRSRPGPGDLARCLHPDGSGRGVVGRVTARGGETVEVVNERVSVSGRSIAVEASCGSVSVVHPLLSTAVELSCSEESDGRSRYRVVVDPLTRDRQRVQRVEPGKVFLVSDNRHLHFDSRDFGEVDESTCVRLDVVLCGANPLNARRWLKFL